MPTLVGPDVPEESQPRSAGHATDKWDELPADTLAALDAILGQTAPAPPPMVALTPVPEPWVRPAPRLVDRRAPVVDLSVEITRDADGTPSIGRVRERRPLSVRLGQKGWIASAFIGGGITGSLIGWVFMKTWLG